MSKVFCLWDEDHTLRLCYILLLFVNFLVNFLAQRLSILDKNNFKLSIFIMNAKIRTVIKFKKGNVVIPTIVVRFYLNFNK